MKPTVANFITFLTSLYKSNLNYSTICIARSAVNQFLLVSQGQNFSNSTLVTKFLKGIFELRPNIPKHTKIWSVGSVLDDMKTLPTNVNLLQLAGKLCVLFLLLTAQRCQTVHLICIDDIEFVTSGLIIHTNHLLKQSRPGYHLPSIELSSYPNNSKLCIVTTFQEYLERTKILRGTVKQLLVSTQLPHKGVSKDTVARWIKLFLQKAGISINYSAHSIRAASASNVKAKKLDLPSILKTAGWSQARTFAKHYDKTIVENDNQFANMVLQECHNV
jgi:hypothetical protein